MATDFEVLRKKLRQGAAIAEPLKRRLWVLGVITLNGYVHWGWEDDRRWIGRLLVLHADRLDWAYLERRATTEGTAEALTETRKEVRAGENR